ncbi:energy transducer TonB [Hymenobacter properus]|uniref:Energy transducer TonB n=1 Tax=Hymenobacter properus TaxID=2791026 RepID=A0A931BCM7_9BACT|nr:energy transducer TonB [Hymenobacter properus]MBF9140228.1 energy transducer TonB [Hymenobacter properus]MBR7719035.1 energy transducer TonB [Microvirga sp. SRT04]
MLKFWSALLAVPALLLAAAPASAQTDPEPEATTVAPRPKTTEYYSADHRLLPTAQGASYRLETTYRDSVAGTVRMYDAAGKLQRITAFGHVRLQVRHGATTTWYDTGQMHTMEGYQANQRHGELLVYYPDGKLRRRDQFVKGLRTAGECFGPDGQPVPYFEYRVMPVYSEGDGSNMAVVQAIQRRTTYPQAALRLALNARILIGFTIDAQGRVGAVHIEKEPMPEQIAPSLRAAFQEIKSSALEAARQLKPFRPGQLDGQTVAVSYSVPITFRIE